MRGRKGTGPAGARRERRQVRGMRLLAAYQVAYWRRVLLALDPRATPAKLARGEQANERTRERWLRFVAHAPARDVEDVKRRLGAAPQSSSPSQPVP